MGFSDADREALYARLSDHAAAGHIDLAELERRVATVNGASTREAALGALAGLPALPAGAGSPPAGAGRPRWGRGHGDAEGPRGDWRPTAERFRDPKSGKIMRVWEDGAGGRHYVPDG